MPSTKVEQVANGYILPEQCASKAFKCWVAKLASIKVQERSIEGQHSRVSRILKRAPTASLSYLSTELRWDALCKLVTAQPGILETSAHRMLLIEKLVGFRAAVLTLG